MLYQILGLLIQIIGIVVVSRLGGMVAEKLVPRSKWLAIIIGGGILLAVASVILIIQPPITFLVQTAAFWLTFFAGGIVVRARQILFNI